LKKGSSKESAGIVNLLLGETTVARAHIGWGPEEVREQFKLLAGQGTKYKEKSPQEKRDYIKREELK